MWTSLGSPIRFQAQSNPTTAVVKVQVAQALKANQVDYVKSLQAFSIDTIVVWTEPKHYDAVIEQMNNRGNSFAPEPFPNGAVNEFTLLMPGPHGQKVLVAIEPEGSIAPYCDYGIPVEKHADPYNP